jgi:Tfp pilus assembly protein PilF
LAVAILTAVAYGPSLRNGFVNWDDHEYVLENPRIRAWTAANLCSIWTEIRGANYHPLVFMTHLVEYPLWGLHPAGYHAVNVALHILSSVLVLFLLTDLGMGVATAGLAALWFGVHPVHVESVAWIAERKDVLCGVFYLWALRLYVRNTQSARPRLPWAALGVYLLALLSKPMAITWPVVTVLCDELMRRRVDRRWWREKAAMIAPTATFALATWLIQREKMGIQPQVAHLGANVLLACRAFAFYPLKLLYPAKLCAFYPRTPWGHAVALGSIVAWAALLLVGVVAWCLRRRIRVVPFGIGWYAVTLLPVCGIVPIGFVFAADRYLYLPSIGLLLVAAWGVVRIAEGVPWARKGLGVLVAVSVAACLLLTWQRERVWHDGVALWTDTVRQAPNHFTWRLLAMAQMEQGRLDAAEVSIRKSLADSETQFGRFYLAEILRLRGRPAEAFGWYERFLAEQGWYVPALSGCGVALMALDRSAEAAVKFARCVNAEPGSPDHWANLGWALMESGDAAQARRCFDTALTLAPDNIPARYNLGVLLMWDNASEAAEAQFRRVLALDPRHRYSLVNLGVILGRQQRYEEARETLNRALRLYPDDAVARQELDALPNR